jgi:hypothetical protein
MKRISLSGILAVILSCWFGPVWSGNWIIQGKVVNKDKEPLPKLIVTAYDKDLEYDDLLGITTTGKEGNFTIVYIEEGFAEDAPDIYLEISDRKGNLVYTSEEEVRMNASPDEYFDIIIDGEEP